MKPRAASRAGRGRAERRTVRGILIFLSVLLAAACGTPKAPLAVPASADPAFNGTDTAWIEVLIAMDEQLEPLLALAPRHTRTAAVTGLATQVGAVVTPELTTLRSLHDRAGLPAGNPHEGMEMPGMVTADQLAGASKLDGTAFDAYLRKRVVEHLRQSEALARSELKAGAEPATRALAQDILDTRARLLATAT